jgi:alpha-N-arabinofuranosidase
MANLAQMVNVIAPVFTRPDGLFLQTIYHPLRLYAEHTQSVALDPLVLGSLLEVSELADLGPLPTLDVIATRDAEGQVLTLAVTNRDPSDSIETVLNISGPQRWSSREVYEVTSTQVTDTNSFADPARVTVRQRSLNSVDRYVFPPHSLTVLRLEV